MLYSNISLDNKIQTLYIDLMHNDIIYDYKIYNNTCLPVMPYAGLKSFQQD